MKTILISVLLVLSSLVSMAQITLDKTYSFSTTLTQVDTDEYVYFLMDVPLKQCRIYNTSHELIKTITITVPSGYYLSDIKFVTRHLFNSDDLIEILYIYEKYVPTATWYYYDYGLGVISENGTLLLTLGNGAFAEVRKEGNSNKLLAYTYIYNLTGLYYDVATKIYSLGGTDTYIELSKIENEIVFPNPSDGKISIRTASLPDFFQGEFKLFNTSGQQVLSVPVAKGEESYISTSELPSGAYIYSLGDKNIQLQSNKIIIR